MFARKVHGKNAKPLSIAAPKNLSEIPHLRRSLLLWVTHSHRLSAWGNRWHHAWSMTVGCPRAT
jgi:hypothetical protein